MCILYIPEDCWRWSLFTLGIQCSLIEFFIFDLLALFKCKLATGSKELQGLVSVK